MKRIKRRIVIANVIVIPICGIVAYGQYVTTHTIKYTIITIMNSVLSITLIIAVILMKNAVVSTKYAQPNQALVNIHGVNFTILILMGTINTILGATNIFKHRSEAKHNYDKVQTIYACYTVLFLLYLIARFLRQK